MLSVPQQSAGNRHQRTLHVARVIAPKRRPPMRVACALLHTAKRLLALC
jgi:hypothetical protein